MEAEFVAEQQAVTAEPEQNILKHTEEHRQSDQNLQLRRCGEVFLQPLDFLALLVTRTLQRECT